MKKILVILLAFCGVQIAASAQNNTSLGIRLGAGTEFGGELILGKFYGNHTRLDFGYGIGLYNRNDAADFVTTINQFYNWQTTGRVKWFAGAGLLESVEFSDGGYSAFNFGVGVQTGVVFDLTAHFSLGLDVRETCKIAGKPTIANRWNTSGSLRLVYRF